MDLKVPINIVEEFSEDDEVNATGLLDMASGDITRVEYEDYDVGIEGLPCEREDYEFSVGILRNRGKEVEFRVEVDVVGQAELGGHERPQRAAVAVLQPAVGADERQAAVGREQPQAALEERDVGSARS